jgi:hypothetical protein
MHGSQQLDMSKQMAAMDTPELLGLMSKHVVITGASGSVR